MIADQAREVFRNAARQGRRVTVRFAASVTTRLHHFRKGEVEPRSVEQFTGKPEVGQTDFDLHDFTAGVSVIYVPYANVKDMTVE